MWKSSIQCSRQKQNCRCIARAVGNLLVRSFITSFLHNPTDRSRSVDRSAAFFLVCASSFLSRPYYPDERPRKSESAALYSRAHVITSSNLRPRSADCEWSEFLLPPIKFKIKENEGSFGAFVKTAHWKCSWRWRNLNFRRSLLGHLSQIKG